MRKTLTFILAVLLVFAMVPSIAIGATGEATTAGATLDVSKVGTVDDQEALKAEYAAAGWTAITTAAEFCAINPIADGNYYLANDIEVEAGENFYLSYGVTNTIVFDGCGYTVSGTNQARAFFSPFAEQRDEDNDETLETYRCNLTVRNLIVKNATVTHNVDYSDEPTSLETENYVQCVGILTDNCGARRTINIDNVYLQGNVTVGGDSANTYYIGLFAGYTANRATVNLTNSYAEGTLTVAEAENARDIGGLIGRCDAASTTIDNCVSNVDITYNTDTIYGNNGVAGISGMAYRAGVTIKNCTNLGDITAKSASTGGILGIHRHDTAVTVDNCLNKGAISSNYYAGGIVGAIGQLGGSTTCKSTVVTDSFNEGSVNAPYGCVSGVANMVLASGIDISTCSNTGVISSDLGLDAGATAGWLSTTNVDAEETRNVRFILALDAEAMKTATYTLTVTFTTSEGSISRSTQKVTGFEGIIAGGIEYYAEDGVVLCGLEITDVPETAWTSVTVAFDADVDTLDFSGSADKPAA